MSVSNTFNPDDFSLGQLTTYQFGTMQAAAFRALKKLSDTLLRKYGLTGMQWHIIGLVLDAHPEGIKISELAKKLDTTMAYATTNVNLLESKQILVRSADTKDKRAHFIHVTESFIPRCTEIETGLRDMLRQSIYARITPAEFHTYTKVMYTFSNL